MSYLQNSTVRRKSLESWTRIEREWVAAALGCCCLHNVMIVHTMAALPATKYPALLPSILSCEYLGTCSTLSHNLQVRDALNRLPKFSLLDKNKTTGFSARSQLSCSDFIFIKLWLCGYPSGFVSWSFWGVGFKRDVLYRAENKSLDDECGRDTQEIGLHGDNRAFWPPSRERNFELKIWLKLRYIE